MRERMFALLCVLTMLSVMRYVAVTSYLFDGCLFDFDVR